MRPIPSSAVCQSGVDLLDALEVAPSLKGLGQEYAQNRLAYLNAKSPTSECQHVGVVVGACVPRGELIVGACCTNSTDFVADHGRTDSCSVYHHAEVGFPGRHGSGHLDGEVRVIATLLGVGADVVDVPAQLAKKWRELALVLVPTMVASDRQRPCGCRTGSRAGRSTPDELHAKLPSCISSKGSNDGPVVDDDCGRAGEARTADLGLGY